MQKSKRNILVILSLLVYTLSVCGVTINKHFCGGELESVTFLKNSDCCGEEAGDEPGDCCKDESIYVANNSETISSNAKLAVNPVFVHLANIFQKELAIQIKQAAVNQPQFFSRGKPPFQSPDLSFIMVFRI